MKFYFLLLSVVVSMPLNAQTYDKILPEFSNTGGTISVTADCKYAPNMGGNGGIAAKEDCYVGYSDGEGFQNFSHRGDNILVIQASLPTGINNKDIIFALKNLKVDGGGWLYLSGFHGVTVSDLNLNESFINIDLEDQKTNSASQSQYGKDPVLVFRDDQTSSSMIKSGLYVQNGDILLGNTQLLIDEFSVILVRKNNSMPPAGNHNNPSIKSQAHIINYGYIIADTLKNGESITVSGGNAPPGIGNQNISGVIDNYGLIDAKNVDNAANGTINFRSFNGEMGAITGMLTNNGTLNIYVAGAKYKKHILAGNNSTGLDQANIVFDNNASEFITANVDNSKTKLVIQKKENNISVFQRTFNSSQRGILNALDSRYNIYTYGGSDFLKKVVNDTYKGVYSGYLSAPLTMLESMKPKLNNASNTNLDINLIGNGFFGSDVGLGGLGGFNINYGVAIGGHITHYQLGYGYGAINNEKKNYNTDIKGHIVSLGAMNQFKLFDKLETETIVYSLIGLFNSLQTLKITNLNTTSPSSKSGFNIFNLGVDTRLGYQINFGNLSVKPFMGFNQTISIRNKLVEKGGFNAVIPSTNSYAMYLSTGLENRYSFSNRKYIYAKLGYEYKMLNTRNLTINLDGIDVIFTTPFGNKFMIDMGGEILFRSTSLIALGVSYNTAITQDIHYFGGNLTYKFKF